MIDGLVNKIENMIPIGSIIQLHGTDKKLMITTYAFEEEADYIGVLWPIGDYDKDVKFAFRTSDIEKIFFRGLEDETFNNYKKKLIDALKNSDNEEMSNNSEMVDNKE